MQAKPKPSSSAAKSPSSVAKPPPSVSEDISEIYSLPAGFPNFSEFERCYGFPLPGYPPQNFIRTCFTLCQGTRFNFSNGGLGSGCKRNSYFFVVFSNPGKEQVPVKYDDRMKTFPQDPHDPTMVFGYLKDGIINLDLARERLHSTVLNPFLVRLGLPTSD
jgi:hypothetical protein